MRMFSDMHGRMKRLLSFGLYFFAFLQVTMAAIREPIPGYFRWADTVYVARVASFEKDKVTFAVMETLRGNPEKVLTLTMPLGCDEVYKADSEWLLVSCDGGRGPGSIGKNTVGWLMKGYCEWLPTPVVRSGKEIYVQDVDRENGKEVSDKAADGTTGLTLDHIKRLLQQKPYSKASKTVVILETLISADTRFKSLQVISDTNDNAYVIGEVRSESDLDALKRLIQSSSTPTKPVISVEVSGTQHL